MSETTLKINWWKVIVFIIVILASAGLGFYFGRKEMGVSEPSKPEVIYIPGETIRDSIPYPVPYREEIDTADVIMACVRDGIYSELFPKRTVVKDSIIYVTKSDSTAIMKDWATKRFYSEELFNSDSLGKCTVDAEVHYNRMKILKYDYTPSIKEVVYPPTKKTAKFSPFVGAGIMTTPSLNAAAGLFIDDSWGFAAQYEYDYKLKTNNFGILVLKKF